MAGPDVVYNPGDIVDLNPREAQRLIDVEYAEAVSKADKDVFVQEIQPKQTAPEVGDVIVQEVKPKKKGKKKR